MHKILPQIAGAEIRDHKIEMAEDHVGILLTVGSAGYSPNIRCTWKIVRIVANIPKLIRDGNWRVSEFWGPYKHRIASSEGYGPRQLTASCDQNQTGRKPPQTSRSDIDPILVIGWGSAHPKSGRSSVQRLSVPRCLGSA